LVMVPSVVVAARYEFSMIFRRNPTQTGPDAAQ